MSKIETEGYDPLNNTKSRYRLLVGISMLLVLYVIVKNYIIDPGAKGFLTQTSLVTTNT
ncbi:hypothetical protein BFO01nite_13520 [Brevibacillus formosus]|uniref:Uncharacterized protein n=1 Tax=Brevibacillus formosus TaxID=54913 RepID=A0ABQ0T1V0_9BACL|nr:hypothetical protein BFO01nite_13520 [Brevibacillus formosus]